MMQSAETLLFQAALGVLLSLSLVPSSSIHGVWDYRS